MRPEIHEALARATDVLQSDAEDTEAFEATLVEFDHILSMDIPEHLRVILTVVRVSVQAKIDGADEIAASGLATASLMTKAVLMQNPGDNHDQSTQ